EIAPVKDEIHRVEDGVQALDDAAAQNVQEKKKVILAVESNARMIMMIVAGLAIFVAISIAIAITRSITTPIAMVVAIAGKLAEGDTDQRVVVRGSDETSQLLAAMQRMIDSNALMVTAASSIANGDL